MITKIIRYFKGHLRIKVSGSNVERFINICSANQINLWNLSSINSHYEMSISVKDFRKLKPVIRKTHVKVVITKRTGFAFFLHKYKYRKFLFLGFVLCMFIIYYLSGHIWSININGNLHHTNENLESFLKTIGVETGMKIKQVDCYKISREIRKNYKDILWVSAFVHGTKVYINIKENDVILSDENSTNNTSIYPYDLIAATDCEITKIVTREGIALKREGDIVKKGEIIISGQIPILDDSKKITNYRYCISDADIYGKTILKYIDDLDLNYVLKNKTDTYKKEYYVRLGNFLLSFGGIKNNYKHFTLTGKHYSFRNFAFGTRTVQYCRISNENYNDKQIQKILTSNFNYYCKELEKKGVVILQNDVKIYTWSDKAKAEGYITIEKSVGQLKKSELIEIGELTDGNDGNNN